MFTYPTLLGAPSPGLKDLAGPLRPQGVIPVRKKAIYAISLVLLGGALIIQSVWGADVVGQNRLDVADMHGKRFIKEIIDAAKTHPDGWVTYMRENPNSGKIEHKIAYWAVHDGLIFKAGTYE
jgi:hypothetical protein